MMNTISIKFRLQQDNARNDWIKGFIQDVCSLDIVALSELLDEDIISNDQSKWDFLSHLRDKISALRNEGVNLLLLKEEICLICKAGQPIHFFEAYEGKGLGLKIDYDENGLKDITVCNFSTGCKKMDGKPSWHKSHNYRPQS